jgi:hypothetical protein
MAQYYTAGELEEMLQVKLGTKTGLDNKKFPPDACLAALMRAMHGWSHLMPAALQDSATEVVITVATWPAGIASYTLPSDCARLVGIDLPASTDKFIEMYGLGKVNDQGRALNINAYVERRQTMRRLNCGVVLFCKQGSILTMYPTPTVSLAVSLTYRAYIAEPTDSSSPLTIPKSMVPFMLSGAICGRPRLRRWTPSSCRSSKPRCKSRPRKGSRP